MKELAEKLRQIEGEMRQEKGDIALFALFEREDWLSKWDLVIAAPWTAEGLRKSIDYVFDKLRDRLTHHESLRIARVFPVLPSVPFVRAVHERVGRVDEPKEIPGFTFEGMELKRGYILTSHPEDSPEPRLVEAIAT